MLDVAGSTDVLAVCTDKPRPHERLLTRALGVGRLWMSFMPLMFVAAWTPSTLKPGRDGVVVGAAMLIGCVVLSLHWKLWFYVLE